jgi:hypothetical protein
VCEPEPLSAFVSFETILAVTFQDETLEADLWEQSDIPSPWCIYCIDTAWECGGLDINDPVFGQPWSKYKGIDLGWFTDYDPEEMYDGEEHNCVGPQSSVGHAEAAATTAQSLGNPLIVIAPLTLTPSEIEAYQCHWKTCLFRCDVRIQRTWPGGPGISG